MPNNHAKFCPRCAERHRDKIKGYFYYYKDVDFCPECKDIENITTLQTLLPITNEELKILKEISRDVSFIESMIELHDKDIIEYELKMSQFRNQVKQQEQIKQQEQVQQSSQPKCPHCSSTMIAKISGTERAGSILMWGIFSKKINKSFKCNNCGYTW